MANILGQLTCSTGTKNTGFGSCFLNWDIIKGAFFFDSKQSFTPAQIAVLQDTLNNAATNDVKSQRMYMVHNFVGPIDNSEKVITEKFDYGAEAIVRDGNINWSFQFVDGGACLNNAGRTHNGASNVLFYDNSNKLIGWLVNGDLATIPMQYIYFTPFTLRTGSKTTGYNVMFSFLPKFVNEEVGFVAATFDLAEITGLQDIDIIVNSFNQNTGVVNVTLQTDCGAQNIYDLFHAQISTATLTAFDADGNTIAVNSVTPVAGNKTFNIGLSVASFPDSGTVTLAGAAVSVLVEELIEGYEIGSAALEIVGS